VIWQLDLLIFVVAIVTAIVALRAHDLLAAVAALAGYSLFIALLFAGMGAVDVAFVEAALGAGVTGILFIIALMRTTRHTSGGLESRGARWPALLIIAAFLGLMLYASTGLPDRGDPEAPAQQHVAPTYIEGSIPDSRTPNVVTAILADYRSHDTFGETLVIFTAGLACLLVLRGHAKPAARRGEDDAAPSTPARRDGEEPS
jgi:multicomponent Na+:H+ antiporter subunit B